MKILCLGYYGNEANNLGDELFKSAFQHLFPSFQFAFTDHITIDHLKTTDALFIGGGSLLDQAPQITEEALAAIIALSSLNKLPLFYLGIGAETIIHPIHQQLIKAAKLIAIRSPHLEKVKAINNNAIQIPDLVYSLEGKQAKRQDKSVLILPNATLIPKWNEEHWKHIAWSFFKIEMAQVVEYLINNDYTVAFYSMGNGKEVNDVYAIDEILNATNYKDSNILTQLQGITANTTLFSTYQTIISQRYHGNILAEIAGTPFISIHHHDKLQSTYYNLGSFISYFEVSKNRILNAINNPVKPSIQVIKSHLFEEVVELVNECLNGSHTKTVV